MRQDHRQDPPDRMTADELRTFARAGALHEIERILQTFPELRARVTVNGHAAPPPPAQSALRTATLAHWTKTRTPKPKGTYLSTQPPKAKRTHGELSRLSLRDALRRVLTDAPLRAEDLRAQLEAHGYHHRGRSPFNSRITQEAHELEKHGEVHADRSGGRGKTTWRLATQEPHQ